MQSPTTKVGRPTPNNLAVEPHQGNIRDLGASAGAFGTCENRLRVSELCGSLWLVAPEWSEFTTVEDACPQGAQLQDGARRRGAGEAVWRHNLAMDLHRSSVKVNALTEGFGGLAAPRGRRCTTARVFYRLRQPSGP